ncbi:MAG: hypothetical protein WD008_03730 [Balneolaceae bacterium]
MSLDFKKEELAAYLKKAGDIIQELYSEKLDRRVFPGLSPDEVKILFEDSLPEKDGSANDE